MRWGRPTFRINMKRQRRVRGTNSSFGSLLGPNLSVQRMLPTETSRYVIESKRLLKSAITGGNSKETPRGSKLSAGIRFHTTIRFSLQLTISGAGIAHLPFTVFLTRSFGLTADFSGHYGSQDSLLPRPEPRGAVTA
jgi:hypothetical protein